MGGGGGTAIFGNGEGDGFRAWRGVSHRWWIVSSGRVRGTARKAPGICPSGCTGICESKYGTTLAFFRSVYIEGGCRIGVNCYRSSEGVFSAITIDVEGHRIGARSGVGVGVSAWHLGGGGQRCVINEGRAIALIPDEGQAIPPACILESDRSPHTGGGRCGREDSSYGGVDLDGDDRVARPAMVRSPVPHIVDPNCVPTGIIECEGGDIHRLAG